MFGRLLHCYTIYTFSGLLLLTEFCQVQNSLCVQVLHSPILAALLHGSPAAALGQTLRRGTRNGITELSQRVPPIFGWAAITLGICPHSCTYLLLQSICGTRNSSRQTSLQCLSTISDEVFSDEDKILIKALYLKGYTAKRLSDEFPEKS